MNSYKIFFQILGSFVCIIINVVIVNGQPLSKYIVVDQFGYPPDAIKIAIIRDPIVGYDSLESFIPGKKYQVIDHKGKVVYTSSPIQKFTTAEASSGDRIWWFDFSIVRTPGVYFILDAKNQVRSFTFEIRKDVYNVALKHAFRTFYYQRAGFEKKIPFADTRWEDDASHLQDKVARRFLDKDNVSTARDVSGGWYDAGDYNKYSSWTAYYVVNLMKAYLENPKAWGDNFNIPESGNGIPDILDEAKWGIDFLQKMQLDNGAVLSIVGLAHDSPPSAAKGPSYYGDPNTSATLNVSAAFALSSTVFNSIGMKEYATTLLKRAISGWNWAEENPLVFFRNNDNASGTAGLGAGQQEIDEAGISLAHLEASCYLFYATNDKKYHNFFKQNYHKAEPTHEALVFYTKIANNNPNIKQQIVKDYKNEISQQSLQPFYKHQDPYRAYLNDHNWGSNGVKSRTGSQIYNLISYQIDTTNQVELRTAALGYLNYIHGVNPFNMVYLTNMYEYGGENCANEIFHAWFTNGSKKWDSVKDSLGPAPGFLAGGANSHYNWDDCCPNNCGEDNNAKCYSESISPPKNQPPQKSYKDLNTSWPLNSWSISENSNYYQVNYIRLLSKFID